LRQAELEKKLITEKKALIEAENHAKSLELQRAHSEIANTTTLLEQQ
jgi:hypothetical protein